MTQLWSELTFPIAFTENGHIIWSEREDQRLMNSYRKIPTEKILKLFPNRTWLAIQSRASILKIPRKGIHYTPQKDSRLLELYYHTDMTYKQMSQYFPFRDYASLRMRMVRIRNRDGGSDS